ncbi:MAG TPA: L,D-transpeptidase [Pyrinomonadaceae bacterium]|jgi:murein L,D-transpeptidase YafK|nr:L,D-transpeptidase [Pyrinomonadaceae bacterium]
MKAVVLSICAVLVGVVLILMRGDETHIKSASELYSQTKTDSGALMPLKLPLLNPKIVVQKSKRRLMLYANDKLLRTYPVGLGFNPSKDKIREGDGATPEGEFYIFTKNEKSAYYLSLGISYPNLEDAQRGLRDGLIDRQEYQKIAEAIEKKEAPPQTTALGGQIYIHGRGAQKDWTWGCVALDDQDIKELFDAVPVGTRIIIEH